MDLEKLGTTDPEKIIDVLGERLAYERSGVKLYDAILKKVKASRHTQLKKFSKELEEHREHEVEHAEWCAEQIRSLGGDPDQPTERAQLVHVEAKGLEEVIFGDGPISQAFHALNTAELGDNGGWALLVGLADQLGDEEMKREAQERLKHEEEHLRLTHKLLGMFMTTEVLGNEV